MEFKCDLCDSEFDTKQKLAGHKNGKHRAEIQKRKDRIPVGKRQYKLQAEHRQGKEPRWVNDRDGRLQKFLDGGYNFIDDPDATEGSDGISGKKCKVVDSGSGMKAYLMEIDKDLYDEDQLDKQGEVDKTDKKILNGQFNNTLGAAGYHKDKDGKDMIRYQPK
jgi:hypothetical protein